MPVLRARVDGEWVDILVGPPGLTGPPGPVGPIGPIIYPLGATSGERLILGDLNEPTVKFISEGGEQIGYLTDTQWEIGSTGQSLVRLDPLGGFRLRDGDDTLRGQWSATEGMILRHAAGEGGASGVILADDGLIVIDPVTGDRISITSGNASAVPTPHWAGVPPPDDLTPGNTHDTPAVAVFPAKTLDDIDLRFVAASAPSNLGAQSYTPPASYTEHADVNSPGTISLATSCATRDPAIAIPGAQVFTNTSSAWARRNGHSVIVRGGGAISPSYRNASQGAVYQFTTAAFVFDIDVPVGSLDGDIIAAHVSMASTAVPVGWTVPEGWKQLGVVVSGLGTTHVLASGIWYKRCSPTEPAHHTVAVNMAAAGLTKVQANVISIKDAYGFPGGLDVRFNNRSMPRGLVKDVISTANSTAWDNVDLPAVLDSVNDMDLQVGRSYRLGFDYPITEFATLNGSNMVGVRLQLSINGAAFTDLIRTQIKQVAGVSRQPLASARTYTPLADQQIDLRTQVTNDASPGGYTFQALGASAYRRTVFCEDIGAVF